MAETENTNTAVLDAPNKAAIKEADARVEAEQDAVLARILSDDTDTGSAAQAKGDRSRDESGRFAKQDPKPASKEKPASESKQTPESKPAVPDGVNAEDYRKALTALQFDKVPQKYLDSMDPGELIEWGTARAKNHADIERLKNDLNKAKSAPKETPKQEAKAEPAEVDWTKLVEPVQKQFSDYLADPDFNISEPLTAFGKQIAELATGSLQAKLTAQQEIIDSIQGQFRTQQQDAARSKLTEKWELDNNDRWNQVLEHRKADKNEYASEAEAIEAACRYKFADEIIAKHEANLKTQHKLRENGQPSTQNQKKPVKARTQEEQEDAVLDAILSGDRDKAARIGRSASPSAGELMASDV